MFLADQMLISFDIRIDQFIRYSVFKVLTADSARLCLTSLLWKSRSAVFPGNSYGNMFIPPAVSAIRDRELTLLPSHRSYSNVFINKSGSHLLFHTVSSIVPSAVQVLTVVFGMSTGVAPARIATGQTYYYLHI